MLKILGEIDDLTVVECRGWDAVRGIIGREDLLADQCFLFRDCPMIHSFLVQKPFYAIFISANGDILKKEYMIPNRFSGFYQFSALCLESRIELSDITVHEIFKIISKT